MTDVPVIVIGAGVVGLAVAAELAPRHADLVLLERNPRHGMETSSRNSEVIHAGIYYPRGTLKAQLCVEGNALLYDLCAAHDIAHRRIGKLIVATTQDEEAVLDELQDRAAGNGVSLRRLTAAEAKALEPHVRCTGALLSESTGIVSAHALMDYLLQAARRSGAIVRTSADVIGIDRTNAAYRITMKIGGAIETFESERVVNAAGLESDTVASLAGIDVDSAGYRLHHCKGSYFVAAPAMSRLVSRLVYPVPNPHSLGIHTVIDLGGRLRFGPDVQYVDRTAADFTVDETRRAEFGAAIRTYLPDLRDDHLSPDMAGIRPKLQGPGDPFRDFVIADEAERGLPGFVNLIGIESPGLTAAPAIARMVARMLGA